MVRVKRKAPQVGTVTRKQGLLLVVVVVVVIVVVVTTTVAYLVVGTIVRSTKSTTSRARTTQTISGAGTPVLLQLVQPLPHEGDFQATIKSCLPAEKGPKCKQYLAPEPNAKQRIAFLSPPGHLSACVLKVVQHIASLYNNNYGNREQPVMEVIGSTHVPPYGYGKTHGYTKIIRIMPHPLILDVMQVVHAWMPLHDALYSPVDHALEDLQAVLRQILRFHCRLSHVSAHTAILTLDAQDLHLQQMQKIVDQLLNFMIGNDHVTALISKNHRQELADSVAKCSAEDAQVRAIHILDSIHTTNLYAVLDQVLRDEMELTKNMTVWPCPSFWAAAPAADDRNGRALALSQRLAAALSPNCSDPMASCFVQRDMCEAAGDAKCQK